MADITAEMVKALRDRTGLPMMDCKRALTETKGDPEAAVEWLRKRGAVAAEKKAGRETAEGRLAAHVDRDRGAAALVEILCETAPASNNPVFRDLCGAVARHAALAGDAHAATIARETFVDDPGRTVQDLVHEAINQIRENMKVSRVVRATGRAGAYVHHTGRVAVLVTVEGGGDDELVNDVCMHIAALHPEALTREDMPADRVEREKRIALEQIKGSGKPENLAEKILVGKMNRWFAERVLLEQPFVKDDKQTVGKVLEKAGMKVTGFTRFQIGEV